MTNDRQTQIVMKSMRTPILLNQQPRAEKSIPAPMWLTKRMETLQRMPPPTLSEVDIHFKASAEIRKRLNGKHAA